MLVSFFFFVLYTVATEGVNAQKEQVGGLLLTCLRLWFMIISQEYNILGIKKGWLIMLNNRVSREYVYHVVDNALRNKPEDYIYFTNGTKIKYRYDEDSLEHKILIAKSGLVEPDFRVVCYIPVCVSRYARENGLGITEPRLTDLDATMSGTVYRICTWRQFVRARLL